MPRVNISEVTDDSGVKVPVLVLDYEIVGDNSTGIGIVGSLKTSDNTLGEYTILEWDTRGSTPPILDIAKIVNTDGNSGRVIYVGSVDPAIDHTLVDGDVWIPL